jgi:hypothetical protein
MTVLAKHLDLAAERFTSGSAVRAMAAADEVMERDACADGDRVNILSDRLNDTGHFMSRNDRQETDA